MVINIDAISATFFEIEFTEDIASQYYTQSLPPYGFL